MSNTGKLGFRINFNTERKLTEEQKQQLKVKWTPLSRPFFANI